LLEIFTGNWIGIHQAAEEVPSENLLGLNQVAQEGSSPTACITSWVLVESLMTQEGVWGRFPLKLPR
jgi:hypothetical protein